MRPGFPVSLDLRVVIDTLCVLLNINKLKIRILWTKLNLFIICGRFFIFLNYSGFLVSDTAFVSDVAGAAVSVDEGVSSEYAVAKSAFMSS